MSYAPATVALTIVVAQSVDGVGAGLQSVAIPTLVARVLDGTGRVNMGQGSAVAKRHLFVR